jgi:hypothetical protein
VADEQDDTVTVLAAEKLNEIFHIGLIEFRGELRKGLRLDSRHVH